MHLRYIVIFDRVKNNALKARAGRVRELASIADQRDLKLVAMKDGPVLR
jgi:hypothetical protein